MFDVMAKHDGLALWRPVLPVMLALSSALSACTVSSPDSCPSYLSRPDGGLEVSDAGIGGFSSVGEWRIDSVCQRYCTDDYPVCQLVNRNTVKCQKGCS